MNFTITVGTLFLISAGMLLLLLVRAICRNDIIGEQISLIDKFVLISLFAHIIWAFIVDQLSKVGYQYLVKDDETYYRFAMGLIKYEQLSERNLYHQFLSYLYRIFGQTTVTGRMTNLFFSVATIYPLATIENRLNKNTQFMATRFYACSPFIIFISYFEIKDISLTFFFISAYALVKKLTEKLSMIHLILLIAICIASEQIRDGTGVLPFAVLILSKLHLLGANKTQKRVFGLVSTIIVLGIAVYVGRDYLQYGNYRVDQYQRWIVSQFSNNSIYSRFVITKISDIWKIPFCFLLYALQPLDMLSGNMRYFSEFGMIAKIADVPILLFSIFFIPQYVKKEKWNSLLFLVLYTFTSCINLTNARQGFFLYPIMYLIFFDRFLTTTEDDINNGNVSIYIHMQNWRYAVGSFYILWVLFALYRFVR